MKKTKRKNPRSLSRKTAKDSLLTKPKVNHMESPMESPTGNPMISAQVDPKAKTLSLSLWTTSHFPEAAGLSRESNSRMKRNQVEWPDGRLKRMPNLLQLIKLEVASKAVKKKVLKEARRKASKEASVKASKEGPKVVRMASREAKDVMVDLRAASNAQQASPAAAATQTRGKRDEADEASH